MLEMSFVQEIMRFIPIAHEALDVLDIHSLDFSKIDTEFQNLNKKYNVSKANIEKTKSEIKNFESQITNLDKNFKKEISQRIIELAEHSEKSAKTLSNLQSMIKDVFQKEMNIDRSKEKIVLREKLNEIDFLDEKIVNELLEYALFLRASADRFRGEQETSPYFDDAKALSDYLKKAVA